MVSQDSRPLVAITGAGGRVGRLAAAALTPHYRLRLVDRDWPADVHDTDSVTYATLDVQTAAGSTAAVADAETVIHLAANPNPQQPPSVAVDEVILVAARLIEAVEESAVRRVVYACSIHAMGMYHAEGRVPVSAAWPANPCCAYGAAKAATETLFGLLAARTSVATVGLRFGLVGYGAQERYNAQRLDDGDLNRILLAAMTTPSHASVLFAVSRHHPERWETAPTEACLGIALGPPTDAGQPLVRSGRPRGEDRCLMFAELGRRP